MGFFSGCAVGFDRFIFQIGDGVGQPLEGAGHARKLAVPGRSPKHALEQTRRYGVADHAEMDANLTLLRREKWIDVPVIYKSGRRALITMEKGIPGEKVFDDALKAWQAANAG